MMFKALVAAGPVALLAACASPPPPDVPASLQPQPGAVALQTLSARGLQIYACRARPGDAGAAEWAFVAPQADLFDSQGRAAGTHFAGPQWQGTDGSRVAGSVRARADAPNPASIPWLLLETHPTGPAGAFSGVTHIQRIRTAGGTAPPAAECSSASLGREVRVGYSADYVLFGSR